MTSPIPREPSACYPSPDAPPWLLERPLSRLGDYPVGTPDARVATGRAAHERGRNVLGEFLANAVPWSAIAVLLDTSTTAALWVVGVLNVPLLAWVVAVLNGKVGCSSWACELATFGGHPWLLLGLSGGCVAGLVASAVVTRGLTRAGAVPLGVMGVSGVAGVIAPLGVIAVAVIIVVAIACVLALFAFFVDRF